MILPTKHIQPQDSLIGIGSTLLTNLRGAKTVTELWDGVRHLPGIISFERFVLGLDLLYSMELVELDRGMLKRVGS